MGAAPVWVYYRGGEDRRAPRGFLERSRRLTNNGDRSGKGAATMQTTEPTTRVGVSWLGHIGLYARDLEGLRDFYRDVLGLQVADQDLNRGIVFMSSDPDSEHHMLALARGRTTDDSVDMVQQVS